MFYTLHTWQSQHTSPAARTTTARRIKGKRNSAYDVIGVRGLRRIRSVQHSSGIARLSLLQEMLRLELSIITFFCNLLHNVSSVRWVNSITLQKLCWPPSFSPGCETLYSRKDDILLPRWGYRCVWLVQCKVFSFKRLKCFLKSRLLVLSHGHWEPAGTSISSLGVNQGCQGGL